MNFLSLEIHNFLTIGEARLELDNRGLLLVQGCNEDDTSAKSNGAGKSSVVDALCWALYGVTARGVTGNAVVNRSVGKNCSVRVTLRDDSADDFYYVITRYRMDTDNRNRLKVAKRFDADGDAGRAVALDKGTERETQNVVTRLVGCGLDVFLAAVYAGQEKMPDLPGMTDSVLKALIEEAAGMEVLTRAYEVARQRHHIKATEADSATHVLSAARARVTELEATLAEMEARSKDFEAGRRERAKTELARVPPLKAVIEAAEKERAALMPRETLVKKLADLSAKFAGFNDEKEKLGELNRVAAKCDCEASEAKTRMSVAKEAALRAKEALKTLEEQVGKPCRECGKIYETGDLTTARRERENILAESVEALKARLAAFQAAEAHAETARESAATFAASMTDLTAVAREQSASTTLLNRVDAITRKVDDAKRDIENAKKAASAWLTETNQWADAIKAKQALLDEAKKTVETKEAGMKEIADDVETHAMAAKVFGPAGVRAHILDTVTPFLNERTDEYLGTLADGGIHAIWTTLAKTAKGDLREKFSIEVTNDKGAESFAGLSGGEKRKVRVACTLALQDLVASRATKPIRLFIADEIDHALDDAGLERLMGVLERKARERGTVLIISHNALNAYVPNVVTVTKRGGLATLDGATLRKERAT
jgi:DNA repair exonuclease SbcCD ATPase subunit